MQHGGSGKPTILLVESDWEYLGRLKSHFKVVCRVLMARTARDAESIAASKRIGIFLIASRLEDGSGLELAKKIRQMKQKSVVCLMREKDELIPSHHKIGIRCVEKTEQGLITRSVLNFWLLEKNSSNQNNLEEFRNSIEILSRTQVEGLEAMDFRLTRDKFPRYGRSVIYRHPEHREIIDIGIASMRGCYGKCRMCLSGRIKKYVTKLSDYEMVGQFLHSLDSFVSYGFRTKINVGFTCGGDFIFNPDNTYRAIKIMKSSGELDLNFIITTIGSNTKIFKSYVDKMMEFPVSFYWSVHSLDRAKREWLMPATKGQSLEDIRRIFSDYFLMTGRRTTLSWMLVHGFNDSVEDVEKIVKFVDGQPMDVKVMLLANGCLPGYSAITRERGEWFVGQLLAHGINARFRENLGSEDIRNKVSCGTTLPFDGQTHKFAA